MFDMIRGRTPAEINKAIDEATLDVLEQYEDASPDEIHARLRELDRTRDVEGWVELTAGVATLCTVPFAMRSRKLGFLAAIPGAIVLAHALGAVDPLTPLLRMMGVRSKSEIDRERFALKLLRGDFERVERDRSPKSALAAAQGEVGLKEGGPMRNERRRAFRRVSKPAPSAVEEEPLGEALKPENRPTVSGPSGDVTRTEPPIDEQPRP